MKITMICVFIILVFCSGCSTNKQLVPMGGSKADGVVRMSYEVYSLEQPVIDWRKAQDDALRICSSWGYTHAEPFGGQTSRCIARNGFGCTASQVEVNYQCTGGKIEETKTTPQVENVIDKSKAVAIDPKVVVVKMQTVTIYDKPGFSNPVKTIPMGSELKAVGENNEWFIVEVDNKKGWIAKDWVIDK